MKVSYDKGVEIPCPTCLSWSHFIQDNLKIPIYLYKQSINKVNAILYFIFYQLLLSHNAMLYGKQCGS